MYSFNGKLYSITQVLSQIILTSLFFSFFLMVKTFGNSCAALYFCENNDTFVSGFFNE